jgi:hypothetical protein
MEREPEKRIALAFSALGAHEYAGRVSIVEDRSMATAMRLQESRHA